MARERSLARRERGEVETMEPWDTFREMERMMRGVLTGSPLPLMRPSRWLAAAPIGEIIPDVNLKETDKEFILTAEVPGMTKDDINIDVTNDSITISGDKKAEEEHPGERYHIRQQNFGTFSLTFRLPSEVKPDEVKAVYKKGLLDVTIPKAEETKARKVNIEAQE